MRHSGRCHCGALSVTFETARDPAETPLRSCVCSFCRRCGVYVAAVATIDGKSYASLNCNVLEDRAAFVQPPQPVDYARENFVERMARRRRAWTPAVVRS